MKHCLTIAGSDCSGGAGIQADLKTFSALGCFGMSVVTSVVAENTSRVISAHTIPAEVIAQQIEAVFEDIRVDAVKIGMLPDAEVMRTAAKELRKYQPKIIVTDPVMVATSGDALVEEFAQETLKQEILPLTTLLTPNIPEAEALTGRTIRTVEDMKQAALEIGETVSAVLVKGGHLTADAVDILYDGNRHYEFAAERIDTKTTHGTGCTLSSAIAAYLARGLTVYEAVEQGKRYVTEAIRHGLDIGGGHGPTNHFYQWYPN